MRSPHMKSTKFPHTETNSSTAFDSILGNSTHANNNKKYNMNAHVNNNDNGDNDGGINDEFFNTTSRSSKRNHAKSNIMKKLAKEWKIGSVIVLLVVICCLLIFNDINISNNNDNVNSTESESSSSSSSSASSTSSSSMAYEKLGSGLPFGPNGSPNAEGYMDYAYLQETHQPYPSFITLWTLNSSSDKIYLEFPVSFLKSLEEQRSSQETETKAEAEAEAEAETEERGNINDVISNRKGNNRGSGKGSSRQADTTTTILPESAAFDTTTRQDGSSTIEIEETNFIENYFNESDHHTEIGSSSSLLPSDAKFVIFSAMHAKGAIDNQEQHSLLHQPAENTDELLFEFKMSEDGKSIDIMRRQMIIRTSSSEDKVAIDEGVWNGWVTTLPIVALNEVSEQEEDADGNGNKKESSVVVDATDLVEHGFYITDIQTAQVVKSRLVLSDSKGFPQNFRLTVEYLVKNKDLERTIPVALQFSIALLPEKPMRARYSDSRIGYFSTHYYDIGDHRTHAHFDGHYPHESDKIDTKISVVNRKRLEMGENFVPLKYYIDPSVPKKWRPSFKRGVEAWRPAYEAVGYGPEAITAILPEDDDWPEDYDAGDVRYSSITWAIDITSTFALGPSIIDPRSGEIINSDIIFTNGWLKHWLGTLEKTDPGYTSSSSSSSSSSNSRTRLENNHNHDHHDHDHEHGHGNFDHKHNEFRKNVFGISDDRNNNRLTTSSYRHFVRGACQEMRLKDDLSPYFLQRELNHRRELENKAAREAGEDPNKNAKSFFMPDDIIEEGLADVVMHEVGHTLGLRHNFKGSTQRSWNDLQDYDITSTIGLTSSVMDYLPTNIVSGRKVGAKVNYFTPVIGEYDYLAIAYGYSELEGELDGVQHLELKRLADHNLAFATDEDDSRPNGMDPFTNVFDMSSTPIAYYKDRLALVEELRPNLLENSVFLGDEYTRYANMEMGLLRQIKLAGMYMGKYIGGFDIARMTRSANSTTAPIATVSIEEQTDALETIIRILTEGNDDSDNSLLFPHASNLPYMLEKDGVCEGLHQYCLGRKPINMLNAIDDMRRGLIDVIFQPERLDRVRSIEWYHKAMGTESLSISSLFRTVTNAIWGVDLALSDEVKNSRYWDLQTYYLETLMMLAKETGISSEITAVATGEIFMLQASIQSALKEENIVNESSYPLLKSAELIFKKNEFDV